MHRKSVLITGKIIAGFQLLGIEQPVTRDLTNNQVVQVIGCVCAYTEAPTLGDCSPGKLRVTLIAVIQCTWLPPIKGHGTYYADMQLPDCCTHRASLDTRHGLMPVM